MTKCPSYLIELFATSSNINSATAVDWDEIIRYSSSELMLPAVWPRVTLLGLDAQVPHHIREVLVTAEGLNEERNRCFLNEAIDAALILNSIGVFPVALKGIAYLLLGLFPSLGSRYLQDIDLLVSQEEFSRATEVLHSRGYRDHLTDPLAPLRHHGPAMSRASRPPIELHHRVGLGICERLLPTAEIIAGASCLTFGGARFLMPNPTHMVSHLVIHSQLHNAYRYRAFPPLRALCDLLLLSQRFSIDWTSLSARYESQAEYLTLALHLRQMERTLAMPRSHAFDIGWGGRIRWHRRLAFANNPILRLLDPTYIFMATFRNRTRIIARLLEDPSQWWLILRALGQSQYYYALFR